MSPMSSRIFYFLFSYGQLESVLSFMDLRLVGVFLGRADLASLDVFPSTIDEVLLVL